MCVTSDILGILPELQANSEYQTTKYKTEPVGYSALHAYGAPYFSACHCLSSLDLNILRVVTATVPSQVKCVSDYTIGLQFVQQSLVRYSVKCFAEIEIDGINRINQNLTSLSTVL